MYHSRFQKYIKRIHLKCSFTVPKPKKKECEEPKKMECGFGQVLKQKTGADECPEFSCGKQSVFGIPNIHLVVFVSCVFYHEN